MSAPVTEKNLEIFSRQKVKLEKEGKLDAPHVTGQLRFRMHVRFDPASAELTFDTPVDVNLCLQQSSSRTYILSMSSENCNQDSREGNKGLSLRTAVDRFIMSERIGG